MHREKTESKGIDFYKLIAIGILFINCYIIYAAPSHMLIQHYND